MVLEYIIFASTYFNISFSYNFKADYVFGVPIPCVYS